MYLNWQTIKTHENKHEQWKSRKKVVERSLRLNRNGSDDVDNDTHNVLCHAWGLSVIHCKRPLLFDSFSITTKFQSKHAMVRKKHKKKHISATFICYTLEFDWINYFVISINIKLKKLHINIWYIPNIISVILVCIICVDFMAGRCTQDESNEFGSSAPLSSVEMTKAAVANMKANEKKRRKNERTTECEWMKDNLSYLWSGLAVFWVIIV